MLLLLFLFSTAASVIQPLPAFTSRGTNEISSECLDKIFQSACGTRCSESNNSQAPVRPHPTYINLHIFEAVGGPPSFESHQCLKMRTTGRRRLLAMTGAEALDNFQCIHTHPHSVIFYRHASSAQFIHQPYCTTVLTTVSQLPCARRR